MRGVKESFSLCEKEEPRNLNQGLDHSSGRFAVAQERMCPRALGEVR